MQVTRFGKPGRAALSLAILAGCSGGAAPDAPVAPEFVHVGTVRGITDDVPVDGFFLIAIGLDEGGTVEEPVSGLGGWQAPPPLTDERRALLDAVQRLEVGDRVRAEGTRSGDYPGITALVILESPRAGFGARRAHR